ncbi:MAG: tRNA pseudouridine synthase A [Phycisphaerales bacterium]
MPRYKLTIAYDGTDFCGWQKQEPLADTNPDREAGAGGTPAGADARPTGSAFGPSTPLIESTREGRVALRTVQGVLEQAVRGVTRESVELSGASRTDSGVHARGQVAAFTCEPREPETDIAGTSGRTGWPISRGTSGLLAAINSRLPDDVVVVAAEPADNAFDPVADVVSKEYTYTFHVSPSRPLWDRRFVHHVWNPAGLNVEPMNTAAAMLVGEHDFAAFAAAGHGRLSTVRTIHALTVARESPERVVLRISGSGFLWNMVRIISGTLMDVGLGRRTAADVCTALESGERTKAGPTLPPEGLCLEWIRYGG